MNAVVDIIDQLPAAMQNIGFLLATSIIIFKLGKTVF